MNIIRFCWRSIKGRLLDKVYFCAYAILYIPAFADKVPIHEP
jgi:hypothetical protein